MLVNAANPSPLGWSLPLPRPMFFAVAGYLPAVPSVFAAGSPTRFSRGLAGKTIPQANHTFRRNRVLSSLYLSAHRLGSPPKGLHGEGALKELFAKGGYSGHAGNLAPLDVDRLALPPDGFTPVPLEVLERKADRKLVEGLL